MTRSEVQPFTDKQIELVTTCASAKRRMGRQSPSARPYVAGLPAKEMELAREIAMLGYSEGQNVKYDPRIDEIESARLAEAAKEFASIPVDVIAFASRLEKCIARSNAVRHLPKLIEDLRFKRGDDPRE